MGNCRLLAILIAIWVVFIAGMSVFAVLYHNYHHVPEAAVYAAVEDNFPGYKVDQVYKIRKTGNATLYLVSFYLPVTTAKDSRRAAFVAISPAGYKITLLE